MSGDNELQRVAGALGFVFSDTRLLEAALSHSSYANETRETADVPQSRLAFVGDAIIKAAASFLVTERFPGAGNGDLTHHRDALVCEATLAGKARDLGIHSALRVGRGVEREGGRANPRIICEALEACIGAIYEAANDFGVRASAVARNLLAPLLDSPESGARSAKSQLQELSARLHEGAPTYETVGQHGPPHATVFAVVCKTARGPIGPRRGPFPASSADRCGSGSAARPSVGQC